MQRGFYVFLVSLAVIAGCARTPDALISRQIAILDETGDALSSITDEASAKSAAAKLARLQRDLDRLVPHIKALKLLDKERKTLEDEHRNDMQAALEKYEKELARVRSLHLKVGGLSELDEAVAK